MNPDKSGLKLLGIILDGFHVLEFGVSVAAESVFCGACALVSALHGMS